MDRPAIRNLGKGGRLSGSCCRLLGWVGWCVGIGLDAGPLRGRLGAGAVLCRWVVLTRFGNFAESCKGLGLVVVCV